MPFYAIDRLGFATNSPYPRTRGTTAMPPNKSFEDITPEDLLLNLLLLRSQRFFDLYYWSLLVNTTVGTIACVLLSIGQNQESIICAITYFGSTTVIRQLGKESNRSLTVLIDYWQEN
jgi:hypothetical protein